MQVWFQPTPNNLMHIHPNIFAMNNQMNKEFGKWEIVNSVGPEFSPWLSHLQTGGLLGLAQPWPRWSKPARASRARGA
jgi:hypothetical protein